MSLNLSPLDEQLTKLDQEGRKKRRLYLYITSALAVVAIIAGWLIWNVALDPHVYVTGCHTISLNGEPVEVISGSGTYDEFWVRGFSYSYIVDITLDSKGCIETAKGRRGERRDPYP